MNPSLNVEKQFQIINSQHVTDFLNIYYTTVPLTTTAVKSHEALSLPFSYWLGSKLIIYIYII